MLDASGEAILIKCYGRYAGHEGDAMKSGDYLKAEIAEVEHCSCRKTCPIGELCGTSWSSGIAPLFPAVINVESEELIWTNLRFENRVYIIQSGVLACMGHSEAGEEIPFALFGRGNAIGLIDIYAPSSVSGDYHIRTIVPGKICSVPAKALRRRLESLPQGHTQKILACAHASESSSAFTQTKILFRKSLQERIIALLLHLRELVQRSGRDLSVLKITHDEIALLVLSDRVSTTRVLHKMRDEGIIDLGYKSISIDEDKLDEVSGGYQVITHFYTVDQASSLYEDKI